MASSTSFFEQTQSAPAGMWQALRWNLARALIVTRREVIDMLRDWRIVTPTILLTIVFPGIANWGANRMTGWMASYGAEVLAERMVPFLLLTVGFFPISFSLIIALESFVGEKERRSLEPLLATPLTDLQLYLGKTLAATVPPLLASLLGIAVYLIGVRATLGWLPSLTLLLQIILLTVGEALVMVSGAVVVSSQVTSVRAANLLASFIIIPMALLIQAEALIMLWGQYYVLWAMVVGLFVIHLVLVRMGIRSFNREELLGGEIDELNLGRMLRRLVTLTVARRADGPRRSAPRWYRDEVLAVVWENRGAVALVAVVMLAGLLIGLRYGETMVIPAEAFDLENWQERFDAMLLQTGLAGAGGILWVVAQNLRVLAIASALGVFSLGVLAVIILMAPMIIIGYLTSQMVAAGFGPPVILAALAPHSLLELPAALLAGALAVRLGASVLAPPPGRSIGASWVEALADTLRLWALLVLPLLLAAAAVEVYLTPILVRLAVGAA